MTSTYQTITVSYIHGLACYYDEDDNEITEILESRVGKPIEVQWPSGPLLVETLAQRSVGDDFDFGINVDHHGVELWVPIEAVKIRHNYLKGEGT
jgi:hypothetical protein